MMEVNRKDVIDTIMLLWEHAVGDHNEETIDGNYLARLLGSEQHWPKWGIS